METACEINSVASDAKKRYLGPWFFLVIINPLLIDGGCRGLVSNTDLVIQSILESQLPNYNCNEGGGVRSKNNNISILDLPVITLHG